MTDDELAAIKARAEAATPGPWARDMGHISTVCSLGPDGRVLAKFAHFHRNGSWESTVQDDENAAFIAHAREDIPALLAEAERLREIVRAVAEAEIIATHPTFGETTIRIAADARLFEQARAILGQ